VQPLPSRSGCVYAGVGWEKGKVEKQVGLVRERFFTPRLRFKSYDEMNAWLVDKCISHAKSHHHHSTAQHGLTAFVAS
jgi:hypothetical protein